MVGDDQGWIKEAGDIAVAKFGCKIFSKTLFHIPTGGSHDQSTFNHENFETKCAGETVTLQSANSAMLSLRHMSHGEHDLKGVCADVHAPTSSVCSHGVWAGNVELGIRWHNYICSCSASAHHHQALLLRYIIL